MLRAARVARGSHPATPASTKPAPLRVPSPTARPPAVVRAVPSSPGPLSVASCPYSSAAQLALPMFSGRLERALCRREPLDNLACKAHLVRDFSADPARLNGAQRSLLSGAPVPLALRALHNERSFSSRSGAPEAKEETTKVRRVVHTQMSDSCRAIRIARNSILTVPLSLIA